MKTSHGMAIGIVAIAGAAIAMGVRNDAGGDRAPTLDLLGAQREQARAMEVRVREQAEAAAAEARAAATDGRAALVAGPRPGQPGPLFDGIRFGSAGLSGSVATMQRASDAATRAGVGVGLEPWRLTARVSPDLADRIFHAWGDPPRDRPLHDAQTAAALTVREEAGQVVFTWTPYEPLAHLIDPGDDRPPGVTPFSTVGARLGDLTLALGDHLQATRGGAYTWQLPPLEDGSAMTATLDTEAGVITRVRISILEPPDDVARALRAAYGDAGTYGIGPWRHRGLAIEIDGHPPDGATVTALRAK